jgi:hypothetical protein
MDSLSQTLLDPLRILIRNRTFDKKGDYLDEYIAYHSPTLYAAYDWRVRRVRIPTSAVFNWLLLGIGLLLQLGFASTYTTWAIAITTLAFAAVSLFAWVQLFRRAYSFRKTACDVIRREPRAVAS